MTGLEGPPASRLAVSKDGASLLAAGEDELESTTPVTIDELFSNYIGEFGRRQMWLFSIVSFAWLPAAFATLNMAFFGKDPIREHLWQCTNVSDEVCSSAFQAVDPTDKFCSLQPSQWEWTHPHESVRSDLGLFCDRSWILQVTNSIFFLGFLVGVALAGIASDNYGRKRTLMGVIGLASIATAAPALAYSLIPFIFARFFQGTTVGGIGVVAFTLACEMVGSSCRGILGIVSQCFWGTGVCLLPMLALAVPNWRAQCIACAGSLLTMVPLFPFMPESPRWLLSQMRISESTKVLRDIAHGNGRSMPRNKLAMPRATSGPAVTLLDTFKVPELRTRMLILMFCWFVASMAYYGVSLALEDLPGSLYWNFFLASIVEFPSYAATILLINRLGRRLLSVNMYVLAGIACMMCAVIPSGDPGSTSATFRIITAVIGKFGMASAFAMLFVFTSELFPTVVRNAALGANSAAARIGGIGAPLVVLLAEVMRAGWLSFVVFGITAMCAGFLMLGLPETQGQPLPDTIADVVRGHHHEYTHAADQVFVIDDDEDDFHEDEQ